MVSDLRGHFKLYVLCCTVNWAIRLLRGFLLCFSLCEERHILVLEMNFMIVDVIPASVYSFSKIISTPEGGEFC